MKAKHMDTRVGDLLFRNGISALIVTKGRSLVSVSGWPDRPRQRPTNQDEMDQAIEAWFEMQEEEPNQ